MWNCVDGCFCTVGTSRRQHTQPLRRAAGAGHRQASATVRQGRRATTTTTDKGGDKNTSRRRLKKGANCSPGRHRIPLNVVGARALSRPPGRRPGCLDRSRCSIVHQRQPTGGSCRRIHASSQPSYPYEYPYPNAQKFQFNRVEPRRRRPAGTAGSSEVGNFTCPPPLETSSLGLPRPVCCARADYSGLRTSTYLRVRARGHGSSKFSLLPLLDAARLELHCTCFDPSSLHLLRPTLGSAVLAVQLSRTDPGRTRPLRTADELLRPALEGTCTRIPYPR